MLKILNDRISMTICKNLIYESIISTFRLYIKLLFTPSNAKVKKTNKNKNTNLISPVWSSDNDHKNLQWDQKSQKINNFQLHFHEIK